MGYLESADNCNLGSTTMVSHMQDPTWQGKENLFIAGGEKEEGRAVVNEESVAFHWLNPCQEGRGIFLLLEGFYCHWRVWELPFLVSQFYLIKISVY